MPVCVCLVPELNNWNFYGMNIVQRVCQHMSSKKTQLIEKKEWSARKQSDKLGQYMSFTLSSRCYIMFVCWNASDAIVTCTMCILQCELLILHFLSFCLFNVARHLLLWLYRMFAWFAITHTYTQTNTYAISCYHRENSRLLPFDTACILLRPYLRISFLSLQGLIVVKKGALNIFCCTFRLGCGLNDFGNSANWFLLILFLLIFSEIKFKP